MNSKERILATLNGQTTDHVPLTTWCFGFPAPASLRWQTNGSDVPFWYTKRLEHIHTLPHPWHLEDEFKRAEAWLSLGIDDVLEVSVPWSQSPEVVVKDTVIPAGVPGGDPRFPVMVREYQTPAGGLRHAVKRTEPDPPGWVIQPDHVVLFEDLNIPRAVEHLVRRESHVSSVQYVFAPPGPSQCQWFADRMARLNAFADLHGLPVQAWTAFGMDAAVWMTGAQGAVMMAVDAPEAFGRLLDTIFTTDYARTELAARHPGVDILCQRGWYSSTDFWSPRLFDRFVFPYIVQLADLAHRYHKKYAYVMTTGVEQLGPRLADAGVDLLYFLDPVQDRITLEKAQRLLSERMTLAGGTNALSLKSGDSQRVDNEVRRAIEVLGPTNRFILHPVDALFPDTPWPGVQQMILAWKQCQGL